MDYDYVHDLLNTKAENEIKVEILMERDKLFKENAGQHCYEGQMFVQYKCIIPPHLTTERQLYSLQISCLTIFVFLYTFLYFDYLKCYQNCEFIDFDVRTITANDYTIEFDLLVATYEKYFKERYLDESNPISEIAQFKLYI